MLVLSRKRNEKIKIGDNITITVGEFSLDGRKVRLLIDAPPEVKIWREELWLEMQPKENATNAPLPQNPGPDVHA
jgi:carbon storage regulator